MKSWSAQRLALGTVLMVFREKVVNIKQHRLEEMLDLPSGSVSRFENGYSEPTEDQMRKIGELFGFSPDDWRHMAERLASELSTRQDGLDPDGQYSLQPVEPSVIFDGESVTLPLRLAQRWKQQRAEEARVRERRDILETDTSAYLMQHLGTVRNN